MPGLELNPVILVPGAVMIILALAFVIGWKISERPPWSLFLWGALAMFVSFILRTLVEVFATNLVFQGLTSLPESVGRPAYLFYVAFLGAALDVGIMLLIIRLTGARRANWAGAVAFGIGFGAFWTFILGISGAFSNLRALLSPDLVGIEELFQMQAFIENFWLAFPPQVVERLAAIVGNITAAVLIVYALRARAWRYFWAALVYATLVSGAPIWVMQVMGSADIISLWVTVAVMAVLAIVGLVAVVWLRPMYQERDEIDAAEQTEEGEPAQEEEEELFGEIKPIFHTSPQDREEAAPPAERPDEEHPSPPGASGVEGIHSDDQPPAKDKL